MDEETAKIIVIALTAVGAAAWLAGLTVMLRVTRERKAQALEAAGRFDAESTPRGRAITGGTDVNGQPEELSAKLAERLARNGMGPFGPVKIVICDRREVVFEAAANDLGAMGYGGSGFRRGLARFTGTSKSTRVDYIVETSSRGVLLALGWLFVALGFVAVVTAPWLEFTYVLPNPNLRTQTIQMVQMVHFLWPPFLFASLSRQPARMLRAQMEALVNNLPYS